MERKSAPMLFSRRTEPSTTEFEADAPPHLNDLYRTAARLVGSGGGADDVLQEVYLQAWKSFGQYQPGTNCRAWLFKILLNTLHHYRRKWLNVRMVKENEAVLEQAAATGPSLAEHLTDEAVLAALEENPAGFSGRGAADRCGRVLVCGVGGRKFIHLTLQKGSGMLSLVIARKNPGETLGGLTPELLASGIPVYQAPADRYEVAGFEAGPCLAFVVSELRGKANLQIAAGIAPAVREFLEKAG